MKSCVSEETHLPLYIPLFVFLSFFFLSFLFSLSLYPFLLFPLSPYLSPLSFSLPSCFFLSLPIYLSPLSLFLFSLSLLLLHTYCSYVLIYVFSSASTRFFQRTCRHFELPRQGLVYVFLVHKRSQTLLLRTTYAIARVQEAISKMIFSAT